MQKPVIFFVDDEPNVLNGLKRFCRSQRHVWDMHFYDGGEAAFEALASNPADVVVSDMRMPGVNGADLFEQISLHWPGIIRIMLSGEAEPDQTMRTVGRSHRFLAKPCDPESLIRAIEAPLQQKDKLNLPTVEQDHSYLDRLQTPASLFASLIDYLDQPQAEEEGLAALVGQDAALSARLLQLANSAYFGRPVTTCNIQKAVETIGCDRIATLLKRGRLGNHAPVSFEQQKAPFYQFQKQLIRQWQAQSMHQSLTPDQQDLGFAACLFCGLGLTDEKPETANKAIPAYMVTLLGLPDALADILTDIAQSKTAYSNPDAVLEILFASLHDSHNQAA